MRNEECNETVGIIANEENLVDTIDDLLYAGFERHEISVQGAPARLAKDLGEAYIDPKLIKDNPSAPRKEVSMPEDMNWGIALMVALPTFLGMIMGILVVDIEEAYHHIGIGVLVGALIGGSAGYLIGRLIKYLHHRKSKKQAKKGGFVIWVRTQTAQKIQQAKDILAEHDARDVHCMHRG